MLSQFLPMRQKEDISYSCNYYFSFWCIFFLPFQPVLLKILLIIMLDYKCKCFPRHNKGTVPPHVGYCCKKYFFQFFIAVFDLLNSENDVCFLLIPLQIKVKLNYIQNIEMKSWKSFLLKINCTLLQTPCNSTLLSFLTNET